MAVDKTKFDDWLKEDLKRDLFFRGGCWIAVALLATYFSVQVDARSINDYLSSQTNAVFRTANIVGTISILMGLLALMFKDMEELDPSTWGRETCRGWYGGMVRRLAGDMTLWTLGALVSVMLVAGIAGANSASTIADWALFSIFYSILLGMVVVVGVLNILVRRAEPLVAKKYRNPKVLFVAYPVVIVLGIVYIWFNHSGWH